jgi:hypothetical protein
MCMLAHHQNYCSSNLKNQRQPRCYSLEHFTALLQVVLLHLWEPRGDTVSQVAILNYGKYVLPPPPPNFFNNVDNFHKFSSQPSCPIITSHSKIRQRVPWQPQTSQEQIVLSSNAQEAQIVCKLLCRFTSDIHEQVCGHVNKRGCTFEDNLEGT